MPGYHNSLSDSVLVTLDIVPTTGTTNTNGAAIDMSGWDGCLYVFNIGAITSTGTFDARIVQSANSNMSGATNITNAAITQVAASGNTNSVMIDVWRPTSRYIRSAAVPATANVSFASIAIRYRASGTLPVTQTAAQLVKVQVN
jgi:hypothetical protein